MKGWTCLVPSSLSLGLWVQIICLDEAHVHLNNELSSDFYLLPLCYLADQWIQSICLLRHCFLSRKSIFFFTILSFLHFNPISSDLSP